MILRMKRGLSPGGRSFRIIRLVFIPRQPAHAAFGKTIPRASIDERQSPTATSRKPQTGADVLVESLVRHGVDVIFAYPGGASMPMHQALTRFRDKIRTILPRHEQGGIFAAEGYARVSGRPGVVMATSGPGALNLVTGLADAKMDSLPVVELKSEEAQQLLGTQASHGPPLAAAWRA